MNTQFNMINKYTGDYCGTCVFDHKEKSWSAVIADHHNSPTLDMLEKHHQTKHLSDWQIVALLDEHLCEPNYIGLKSTLEMAGLDRWDRCGLLKYYKGNCCQDELIFEVTDYVFAEV